MSGRISHEKAHYRIPALTTYVDACELERKFQCARPGERVTYALGPAVSLNAATAAMVRTWHDQGLCLLLREREEGGRGFRYFVQKRAREAAHRQETPADPIAGRPEAKLLQVLVAIAGRGGVLPSLDVLADRADLPSRNAADYRLRLLVKGGFVRIRRESEHRYVEIMNSEAGQ
ncbi:hypothetical protein [Novosphingobium sp. ST904]|uniref:hypothetical protein n=1 Tax=Novosphingobium sp. ST904 TaxID=1684385 RepID=UPI000AF32746|nr:hypothetical protein [Novosphingobium sp. ST904]TCM40086.1 hypothetical protein EDF59_105326 [Novosphingobium sp. ST904]